MFVTQRLGRRIIAKSPVAPLARGFAKQKEIVHACAQRGLNAATQKVSSSIKTLLQEAGDAIKTRSLEPAFAGIDRVEKAAERAASQSKALQPGRSERLMKKVEVVGEKTQISAVEEALLKTWSKLPADELKKVGTISEQWDIRQIKGNVADAFNFFKAQVESFKESEKKPGEFLGRDQNGVIFYFREKSKFGPPTIDVNGIKGLRKIKFLDE